LKLIVKANNSIELLYKANDSAMLLYNLLPYRYSVVRDPYLGLKTVVCQENCWAVGPITSVIQSVRLIPSKAERGTFYIASKIKQSLYFEENIYQTFTPPAYKFHAKHKNATGKRYLRI
jgi:hypothetical protein